jgi:CxxC-x17-CxxC domain-containing protein
MGNFNRDDRSGPRRDFGRRDFGKRSFGDRGPREMHKAVCAECGKSCEVPFQPTDGRPVYCSECFEKKDGGSQAPRRFEDRGQDRGQDRGPRRPSFDRRDEGRPQRSEQRPQNNEQIEAVNRKLDKIMEMLSGLMVKETKTKEAKPEEIVNTDQKKTKVSKKKTPVTDK